MSAPSPARRRASAAPWRLALVLTAAAALYACGDASTPSAPRMAGDPAPAMSRRQAPREEATVTRVTDVALTARGMKGPVSRHRTTKRFANELREVKAHEAVVRPPVSRKPELFDLPPAALTVAAAPAELAGAGLPWKRRHALEDEPNVIVEAEGVGNAPAATLRYYRDGQLVTTITQEYTRRGGHWGLVRRETTGADGQFHDVIDVAWSGTPVDLNAVASATRTLGGMSRLSERAQHPASTFTAYEDYSDCCQDKIDAANAAFESFLWADATALAICTMTPPPADVLACAVATAKAIEKYSEFQTKVEARDACLANPPKCHPTIDDGVVTIGGASGGGGTGPVDTEICYYEVWYYVDTGEIISWTLLGCTTINAA